MRIDIGDTEDVCRARTRISTSRLLARLAENHDYNLPCCITRAQVIEIRSEPDPETTIEVCILPVAETKLTVNGIKRVVCKHFGLSHNDMVSQRRDHRAMRPRMVAIYLTRMLTPHSFPIIGRFFGDRDHTTILHAVRTIENMVSEGHPIARDVTYLHGMLTA